MNERMVHAASLSLLLGVCLLCQFPLKSTAFANANLPGNKIIQRALALHTSKPTGLQATNSDSNSDTASTSTKDNKGTVNPLRLAVLKMGMTELKWTSPLNYEKRVGRYDCASCGSTLFDSSGKYDSGSGWPSFWKTNSEDRVAYKREWDGRIECSCKSCGGHLGHAFPDGPKRKDIPDELLESIPHDDLKTSDPKNVYTRLPRYCMNDASLKFVPR